MPYKKLNSYKVDLPSGKSCIFKSGQDMTGLGPAVTGVTPFAIPAVSGPKVQNCFINANYPRLPRLTITTATGKKSTYCNEATAAGKGDIQTPKRAYAKVILNAAGKKVISCFVETLGIKYAWNMPRWQYDLISADFGDLGIAECTKAGTPDYVWGASAPYPGRAAKFDDTGVDNGNTYITFCSQIKEDSLANGWTLVSESVDVGEFLRR